jgi:hypothetical protein
LQNEREKYWKGRGETNIALMSAAPDLGIHVVALVDGLSLFGEDFLCLL